MNLYIDILFTINLIMNSIIFWVVAKVLKFSTPFKRILLGAAVSALIYCIFLVFFMRFFNFVTAIIALVAGLFVSFGAVGYKKFLHTIVLAHMVAFFIGGMALALYNYININTFMAVVSHFPVGLLFVSIILSYTALSLGNMYIQKMKLLKKSFCNVQIFLRDKTIDITALVDTGMSLSEPTTSWPVIIAEKHHIEKTLELSHYQDKTHLIPYQTIGNQGHLQGIRPDKVIIHTQAQSLETKNVVIGLCDYNLSKKGSYQGLLGPALLEE